MFLGMAYVTLQCDGNLSKPDGHATSLIEADWVKNDACWGVFGGFGRGWSHHYT